MKALEASLVDAALEQNFKELEEARLQEVIAISIAHEVKTKKYFFTRSLRLSEKVLS